MIAARRLKRPVRWTADRAESLQSDAHARDAVTEAELALDADGRFLAMRATTDHAVGAYLGEAACVPVGLGSTMYAGNYDLPAAYLSVDAVFTNTNTIAPYRGAGRPEACYIVERLVDQAAVELGIDPVELRRRNYIKPADMPYQNAIMTVYDSGEFEKIADMAVKLADRDGFADRKAESEAAGRLRGLGITYFIEIGAPFNDRMELYFDPAGGVTVGAGTHSHGQGHQTVYAQMVSEWLGVPFESVRLVQGDTDHVAYGRGTYGSRSVTIGGAALKDAADKVIARARPMAAHLMEAAEADIEFSEGAFTVAGTDKSIGIVDVARASFMPMGWPEEFGIGLRRPARSRPPTATFPTDATSARSRWTPKPARSTSQRYAAVNDSGADHQPAAVRGAGSRGACPGHRPGAVRACRL